MIDTNILLSSIGAAAPYRWLWDTVLAGRLSMLVTTDILLEYEEIIGRKTNAFVANNILQAITRLPQTRFVTVYYWWNLIAEDVDDNKFVDCAINGNAAYIISNDRHFDTLSSLDFPRCTVIRPEVFHDLLF
ncbi:MAG: putative toxin-antitoxin system toxin component, PIN family [Candidatus Kapabacteria bacterium]|nr:putative toxin-antitoxin system toxin component, PIN family [Candidatus Kapabacteria bacterium]